MAPSTIIGTVILLWRKAATKVIVFHAPSGTVPITLSPLGARPLTRAKFVLTAVSSINTNRGGIKHTLLSDPTSACSRHSYARRPLLRPFLAVCGGRFSVFAWRDCLRSTSGATVSGVENPVPRGDLAGVRTGRLCFGVE